MVLPQLRERIDSLSGRIDTDLHQADDRRRDWPRIAIRHTQPRPLKNVEHGRPAGVDDTLLRS